MKYLISLLLPVLCLIGCVSSNQVTRTYQYTEINTLGKEYHAAITVQVDSATAEYNADFVSVGRDSTQWLDPETNRVRSAATTNLRRIRFTKHGTGAAEGFGFGIIPGVALFVGITATNEQHSDLIYRIALVLSGIVGAGGSLIGTCTGAIIGHKTDYIFPTH